MYFSTHLRRQTMAEDIAIVGIGCRFPGADNIDEYWNLLVNGENHVVDIPPERWNNEAFYSENKDEAGKHYVKKAGFLKRHDEWDNRLFGVSDIEATRIDPQQRYVLECTHMALEDGGLTRKSMNGSQTGVYIGVMNDDYKVLASADHDGDTNYTATGMSTTIIASRVSFVYNLQGPCMVVDTACSSSMIAIHLGSQAIRTGDCEMAVCGGVSNIISPDTFIALCKARMMSATGQCQTFCDTADGYARGEGCGVVILKAYSKAVSDGNKIWGILKTGSNQDGRVSQPITAPSGEQQEELLRKVYSQYQIDPTTLQYIECHGTGTPIGDPTETNALGRFITKYRNRATEGSDELRRPSNIDSGYAVTSTDDSASNSSASDNTTEKADSESLNDDEAAVTQKIPIGSVKTNIGHTESAAGVAALIKVLLMMKNGKIVPSLHVNKDRSNVNKKIKLDEYGLEIALEVTDWHPDKDGLRLSCVNSFGFGGSNSHAVVLQKTKDMQRNETCNQESKSKTKVICLSAMEKNSLEAALIETGDALRDGDYSVQDISYTAAFHRDHYPTRTLVFGKNADEIQTLLKVKAQNIDKLESTQSTRLIFVFCGVGTTWQGMCQEMMESEPIFRNTILAIDEYLQPLAGWTIQEKFENDTDYSDPFLNHIAIFCVQVALSTVWSVWGILPDVIIGQSVGEVAAAYVSGALPLKDAVDVIYFRSKILAEMSGGKMMVAGNYPIEKLEALCEKYENKATIAVYNSPTSCTLSGDADIIDQIKTDLEELNETNKDDIMIRPLSVQCAYHSHHVEPCMDVIKEQLAHITKGVCLIDHISTVTGELGQCDDFQTGEYWAENIRKPVKFKDAVLAASQKDVKNVYIELGPRQVLRAHLPNILGDDANGVCLPSMNAKKECVSLYSSLSTLYELGVDINWQSIISSNGHIIPLPHYVFNKSKILYLPEAAKRTLKGIGSNTDTHMYVRKNVSDTAEYRIQIDKETTPFVFDHYFMNALLVPGATYVETAFDVGQKKTNYSAYDLSVSTEFASPFTPAEDKQYSIDVEVVEDNTIDGHKYFVKGDGGRIFCHGTIVHRTERERPKIDIAPVMARCNTHRSQEESYACLERIDFNYGETLSLIEQSWSTERECLVEFLVPDSVKVECKTTHLHPSIIDAMFQTFGILSTIGTDGPTLPKGLGSIVINRPPQTKMYGYSQMVKATPVGNHYNSLLLSKDGNVIAEIQDFYTKTIRISEAPNQSIVYGMQWNQVAIIEEDDESTIENTDDTAGKLVVFGTHRFIDCLSTVPQETDISFYELNDSLADTDTMYRIALDQTSNISAVIFANCHHVQIVKNGNKQVYVNSKHTFMALVMLVKLLKEKNCLFPVFVVTEDVKAAPSIDKAASNVCGSELWGLARSAMAETAYHDLRLVDMALTQMNVDALLKITKPSFHNYNEYILDQGNIYHSEMNEAPDQDIEPNHREVDYEPTENLILKSTKPNVVTTPHFQFKMRPNTDSSNMSKIRLNSMCLHDATLYPTSTVSNDAENTIWPEIDDNGFDVICLEGLGWLEEKSKKMSKVSSKPKYGFCYPVDVSTVVSIPSQCVYDTSAIPAYTSGLMTVGVVLLNVAQMCRQSPTVHVIIGDETNICIQLLTHMLHKNKKTAVTIENWTDVDSGIKTINAHTVVVLRPITHNHVEAMATRYNGMRKIVSMEEYFPRYLQRWVQHNMKELMLDILNTERIFVKSELVDKVPKVYSWIKSLDNNMKNVLKQAVDRDEDNVDEQETELFTLPYPTLVIHNGGETENRIPLRVFRSQIFRRNGCYVLVGGLTGLGWELLQVIAELGGGYIATLSRRTPTEAKLLEIKSIQGKYGCTIIPVQADITDLRALETAVDELETQIGDAKIRGVFHGGGVVSDMLLSNMTMEDVEKPMQPKVLGTWNLHVATKDMPLDFFVMHSSIVSILGNPGQCNYAAGNSFQDSFAHYRRSLGLCGQSINWSTLALGMATENKVLEESLKSQGFYYLSTDDVRSCFMRAVMTNPPQVTFGVFDWGRLEFSPTTKMYPLKFKSLIDKYGTRTRGIKSSNSKYQFEMDEFNKLDEDGKFNAVVELLKKMVLDTFVVDERNLSVDTKFVALGIDSMAAMGFTNSIFEAIQVRLPVVTLLSDTTSIGSLATFIVDSLVNGTMLQAPSGQQPTEDNSSIVEFFQGSVTFMQKSLLYDFVRNPHSKNFMRQADYEVSGLKLKPKDWRVILNYLLKMNPELRTIYKLNKEADVYESVLVPANDADIDLEQVPFDSICTQEATDDRDMVFFDLTKDFPIRFKIACKKDKTRMRMYCHSVVSDLSGTAMIFKDIGSYMRPYICKEDMPEKDTSIVPADAVRTALIPRISDMRRFWRAQLAHDIQPFTFGNNIEEDLDETNWYQIVEHIPTILVEKILNYIQKRGMSLYNFIITTYMLLLHMKTKKERIPLVTNVDMRGHVPQLKSMVTRCINAIPVVGDMRDMGTVSDYVRLSSNRLHNMTQQGGYPYKLIEDEMQSDELRKHIGRHRLVMDNMANLNQTFKHKRVTIKLFNFFHTRHVYETTLYIVYDLQQNKVSLDYGYNAQCVNHDMATKVPGQILSLMQAFMDQEDVAIADIVSGNITLPSVDTASGSSGETVKPNIADKRMSIADDIIADDEIIRPIVEKVRRSFSEASNGPGQGLLLLKEDWFLKETSQGWDHKVHVTLSLDRSLKSRGELILQWGPRNNKGKRSLYLESISEIALKKLNGMNSILLKTANKWFVLKTSSQNVAMDWLKSLKSAEETRSIFSAQSSVAVEHL